MCRPLLNARAGSSLVRAAQTLRTLTNVAAKELSWRSLRPYMLADSVTVQPGASPGTVDLKVRTAQRARCTRAYAGVANALDAAHA